MDMRVREVMTRNVISVESKTTVEEVAKLLMEHRISSVPVVDRQNHVIGFVSEDDLFLKEKGIPFSLVKVPALFSQWVPPEKLGELYSRSRRFTAADVMTHKVVSVHPEDGVGETAELMLRNHIKKLPVVEHGKLIGIVSRADMVKLLVSKKELWREGKRE
jgi:CBS domain-containing protein